jgi:hypothetical protein
MDSIRYPMQNLFNKNGKIIFSIDHSTVKTKNRPSQPQDLKAAANQVNQDIMKNKMKELVPNYENSTTTKVTPKKKIFWS